MSRVGSLPPQSILLEPAVQAATKLLVSFPEHLTRGSLEMVFSAAVALQQQEKQHARHWRVAKVQEAIRAVLTCMESAAALVPLRTQFMESVLDDEKMLAFTSLFPLSTSARGSASESRAPAGGRAARRTAHGLPAAASGVPRL
jgi:hypothetical protein